VTILTVPVNASTKIPAAALALGEGCEVALDPGCYCLDRDHPEGRSPMTDEKEAAAGKSCPWCSAPVTPEATHCPVCGGALAQRESIADLSIVGVTAVDPALQAYDARPLHIPLPVPSGVGPVSRIPRTMAEMAALAALYGRLRPDRPVDPSTVGKPSDAALQAVERLDREDESN
jgi:hypothetical protein